MRYPRRSGILLHPTSLPGGFGIGDLGPAADRWVDALAGARQGLWQVLPLGPTGYGDSPYQCFSALAGNPLLVSPELLADDGLLNADDLRASPSFPAERVDFGPVIEFKQRLLERAFDRFGDHRGPLREGFERFRAEHAHWLEDYALFMALKNAHDGRPWTEWEVGLARRESGALEAARNRLAGAIEAQRFHQFLFFRQWSSLRERASRADIRIVGDAPIFVAHDSADVWAHPELFQLDESGLPTVVAGVPPDFFAATGQLWGNPLYRWEAHAETGYAWWLERLRAAFGLFDVLRLDHFRGFEACWEVPAGHATAELGRWVKAPGRELFTAVRAALGEVPIIAEDLGYITPEVVDLREAFDFPGMKIMQFAFGGDASHPFLPHNYPKHCVAYTGTHDNAPSRAWLESAPEKERRQAMRYLACEEGAFTWALIRAATASVAHTVVVPLQDVLELGDEARMNTPGRSSDNWAWRFRWEDLGEERLARLAELAETYGRAPTGQGKGG